MKVFSLRVLRLIWGLFLYSLGIVFMLKANIGYAPWDVFHAGLSSTLGISFGSASIAVGVSIGAVAVILKEKLGFGSILNMVLIGLMVDIILFFNVIQVSKHMVTGIAMLFIGMLIISCGTYFYISSAFGAGPRDSLMVALTKRTKLSVGGCRGLIELTAAFCGWMLGGMLGIGTVISVFSIGPCIEIVFKLFKFNAALVEHETLDVTYRTFIDLLNRKKDSDSPSP